MKKVNYSYGRPAYKKKKVTKNSDIIIGILDKHRKGFGFVTPIETEEVSQEATEGKNDYEKTAEKRDIFVAASGMHGAMNGDKVEIGLLPEYFTRSRKEGVVLRVLEHSVKEVVGTFKKNKRFGFVVPDDKRFREDVFISKKNFSGAQHGDKVVATIITYPDKENSAEGRISEIVARRNETGADIKALIRAKGMFFTFPSRAAAQAKAIEKAGVAWEKNDRRDLRDKLIITIDGADSKDFDDAISVEKLPNGNYLLGVHIADVTNYVIEDSPLDKEALKRGNSVYLIDYVVPMLPEALSNNICSLRPGEDRLTLSVDIEIDSKGNFVSHEIYKSVIRSKERMVYDDVSDIIEEESKKGEEYLEGLKRKYQYILDDIQLMAELAKILQNKREEHGSIDFDFDEAYIKLDEKGIATSIGIRERRSANRLIEEFMLAANQTVAEHFYWLEAPFVYRIHEKPSVDKIEELRHFLGGLGIVFKGSSDNVHPKTLAGILESIKGTAYENVVGTVMLRSMKKAFYGTECEGHFGLSMKYYCHFTSPIRRYPDLLIHRIIKEYLKKTPDEERIGALTVAAEKAAELSSATERIALELERDVEKLKKCEYMSDHVGEIYDGVISGVTQYGIYVELPNTVEGMVRLEYISGDYFDSEPQKYRVIGRHTGKIYSLGQEVKIKVHAVDVENREIDFTLVQQKGMRGNESKRNNVR